MNAGQFRRFTYLVTVDTQDISKALVQLKADSIQNQLEQLGIITFEIYQKEQETFFLIDTEPSVDSTAISVVFSSLNLDMDVEHMLQNSNAAFSFKSDPLERIYELDQEVVYRPKEGQLKNAIGPKKRFIWTLLLQEDTDLIAEYKRVHGIGQAWPEITANMKSVGVKDMEIYLSGTQAILIMDTIPEFNLEAVGPKWQTLPREKEWQSYVAKFQRTDPESSIQEKWQDMTKL